MVILQPAEFYCCSGTISSNSDTRNKPAMPAGKLAKTIDFSASRAARNKASMSATAALEPKVTAARSTV